MKVPLNLFGPTEEAIFLKRPNRFVVVCSLRGKIIKAFLAYRYPPCPCGVSSGPADPGERSSGMKTGRGAEGNFRLDRREVSNSAPKEISYRIDGRRENLLVKIPSAVRNGTVLRLGGKGKKRGNEAGDLYLKIELG
jgi:hypothetical protein